MKEKLIHIHSPWRRLLIGLMISGLIAFDQVKSPRAKVHWIGSHARPRRLERSLFMVLIFAAMFTFDAHQYAVWALLWGGAASLFVIERTLYKLIKSTGISARSTYDQSF